MKLIIVGGVAGGATAAARARRLNEFAEIILFERGDYISFANCGLPYYVGETIRDRDKLMDVLATAMRGRMTVYDLEELELAYAPPFSSAKDPVNVAGFHAANILKGDVNCVHWHQLGEFDPGTTVIVDVRTKKELDEDGDIDGAINIPIDELRDKIDALDRTKTYILICLAGLRSYLGCRMLSANGLKSYSLSGGYGLYKHVRLT